MSENRYSQRIPESRWQLHKTTIHRLYVLENKPLTAPGGVRDIMFTIHGFSATKAQYETRLKKWGFFKYTSAHGRRNRASILQNRRIDRPMGELEYDMPTHTCWPPRNIPIRTFSPHHSARRPPSQDTEAFSLTSATSQSPIPHPSFETLTSQDQTNAAFESAWPTLTTDNSTAASRDFYYRESSGHSRSLNFSPYGMNVHDLIGWSVLGQSTSNSVLASLSQSATILSSEFSTPDFATSIMPIISRMFPKAESSLPIILLGDSSELESAISNTSHPSTSQLLRQLGVDHQFIYTIFHRLVNDGNATRGLENPQTKLDHFFKLGITYCFSLEEQILVSIFKAIPSPYDMALVQNVFCAALILGDGFVLNVILNMGRSIRVNRPVLLGETHYYPLEFTSGRGHIQATQVLLDHGADPNLRKNSYFLSGIGGSSRQERYREARLQILRLLIDHGLKIGPGEATQRMHRCKDRDELLLLATYSLDECVETFFARRALLLLVLQPDWDDSFSATLQAILDRTSSDIVGGQDIWESVLSESLSGAVLHSHKSAIDILLSMGAIPDVSCLISAVLGNDLEMFESFLDRGLDPNVQSPVLIYNPPGYYKPDNDRTALSESIKKTSKGAFRILQARGFVSNLAHQPAGFVAAFTAACQIGDSTLVEQLLSLRSFPWRLARIGKAIEAASRENQHHLINRLLSVGIRPTLRCLELAVKHKQLTAVKLLASCMDIPTILEANIGYYDSVDLQRDIVRPYDNNIIVGALQWGDQTAIEQILEIGHPVNVSIQVKLDDFRDWNLPPVFQPNGTLDGHPRQVHLSLLSAAIMKGNTTAAKTLIAHGAHTELFSSRLTSYQSRMIRKSGVPFHEWTLTPLAAGAVRNNLPLIKEFLREGVDPFDNSALFVCAVLDLEDVVTLLLSAFKNRYPDGAQSFGSDALHHSIKSGNARLLKLLAQHTDSIAPVVDKERGYFSTSFTSPFGEAIRLHSTINGSREALDLLLPLLKDPHAVIHKDPKRGTMTPMLYAIFLNSLETVQKLHQAGANISLPPRSLIPRTPLQAAAETGSKDIIQYLLANNVNPNEPPATCAGATALQLAAITGNIAIATILLDEGADINAPPAFFDGRTAFEGATEHGRIEMMLFLVSRGADLLFNNGEQYRRAVAFAEDNLQHVAKTLADELYGKALANQRTNFIDMGGDAWAGVGMGGLEDFLS